MKEHRLAGVTIALALWIAAAGCGNRNGSLVGYQPEGQADSGTLLVQVDTTGGVTRATATVFLKAPTNRIRLYDDLNGKGFLPLDGTSEPVRSLTTGWGVYLQTINPYDPLANHTLLARGSRDGQENVLSPLTNNAIIPAGPAAALVASRDTLALAPRAPVVNPDAAPVIPEDSLYFNIGVVAEARTILFEIAGNQVTGDILKLSLQPGGVEFTAFETLLPFVGGLFKWRVDEYDAGNRLVATTSVPGSFVIGPPKVAGNPLVFHFVLRPWTIPTGRNAAVSGVAATQTLDVPIRSSAGTFPR